MHSWLHEVASCFIDFFPYLVERVPTTNHKRNAFQKIQLLSGILGLVLHFEFVVDVAMLLASRVESIF